MAIQFDEIPGSIRKPGQYIEQDWRGAVSTLPSNAGKCLIIAPLGAGASAEPLKIVDIYSTAELDTLFGANSAPARMVKAAVKANSRMFLSVCPLAAAAKSVEPALTVIEGAGHTMMATSLTDSTNITLIRDYINEVSSATEQRPIYHFAAQTGALADAVTYAAAANDGRMLTALLRGTGTPPEELAAAFMAVAASEEDPARPLNTLEITGIQIPSQEDWLTRTEQETLLYSGVTPLEATDDGKIRIVRAVTTYTKNAQGTADPSKLDFTSIRSADYVRKAIKTNISIKYPREKLPPRMLDAVWGVIYDTLKSCETLEIVEGVDDYRDRIIVEKNSQQSGRLDAYIPAELVPGFHIFAGKIGVILG